MSDIVSSLTTQRERPCHSYTQGMGAMWDLRRAAALYVKKKPLEMVSVLATLADLTHVP